MAVRMGSRRTRERDTQSQEAGLQRLSVASLGTGPHYDIFVRAIKHVLSTEISEITLAQIVDGLPLSAVERDTYTSSGYLCGDHPLHEKHQQLCPGVLEKARQLYAEFDINSLQLSSNVSRRKQLSHSCLRSHLLSLS